MGHRVIRLKLRCPLEFPLRALHLADLSIVHSECEAAKGVVWRERYCFLQGANRFFSLTLLHQEISEIHIRLFAGAKGLFLPGDRPTISFDRGRGLAVGL